MGELVIEEKDYGQIKDMLQLTSLSDANFKAFMHVCVTYGVDPRMRQISCWESFEGGRKNLIVYMTIDGWQEIANRDSNYDGQETGVLYEGDTFIKKGGGQYVYESGNNWGKKDKIVGAFAVIYRKDRRIPTLKDVSFGDYYKAGRRKDGTTYETTWDKYPAAMVEKVALSRAIKASFSISGIYVDAEIDSMRNYQAEDNKNKQTSENTTRQTSENKSIPEVNKGKQAFITDIIRITKWDEVTHEQYTNIRNAIIEECSEKGSTVSQLRKSNIDDYNDRLYFVIKNLGYMDDAQVVEDDNPIEAEVVNENNE